MNLYAILVIALALAVDAFSVAVASGVSLDSVDFRRTFRLSWHFGVFQTMMTIIGWTVGLSVRSLIESFDHWVAFGMLLFVGARMIIETFRGQKEANKTVDPTKGTMLVFLSIATSIDALAVGISFSMLDMTIWTPALIIGVVAFILTAAGIHLGRVMKSTLNLSHYAEVGAGMVLIGIGIKILYDHHVFG
jgi:putative Mn2+ efflux pump MntP